MPTVAVIATLDTKGREAAFLCRQIRAAGVDAVVIDVGVREAVDCVADVPRDRIAVAGGSSTAALLAGNDRGQAVGVMGQGLAVVLTEMVARKEIQAAIGIGGSGGTSICATAFRGLPFGFAKMLVTTLPLNQMGPYVGTKDISVMPSVVDIEGLNRISIPVLSNAAAAIAGMAQSVPPAMETKPLIGVTMFGVTTACVKQACAILEEAGYETVVFHAVGTGGRTFESLVDDGFFAGVLDVTTTEWCDELVGGILSAGPGRLDAAARKGVPQVVCPGALDMVNFGSRDSVPAEFAGRTFYVHNPQVTLMRTTAEESQQLGEIIARKLNASVGPTTLCLPLRGVSAIDTVGQPFDDPAARAALFDALRKHVDRRRVQIMELDCHINDAEFSAAIARELLSNLRLRSTAQ